MKNIITLIILFVCQSAYSQNQLFIGTKSFTATNVWEFYPPKRTFRDDTIIIQVAKSSNNSVLMISANSELGKATISGPIIVYLTDGTVISLTSKLANDYADDRISVIYLISPLDINKLKVSNIVNIRFNYTHPFGNRMGLTARNGQIYNNGIFESKMKEFQTATEVISLFSK